MNLKTMTDKTLVDSTTGIIREERELLTNLLSHFREIERRRLFCDFGYGSLHKMLVGHFGYSDDEAYRRTSAMRLISEIPEVEHKINQGELSLTHLSVANTFFKQERKLSQRQFGRDEKLTFLNKISHQPIREAQRLAISSSVSQVQMRPEKIFSVSADHLEFRFVAPIKLEEKIKELKGLLAHKYPHLSTAELIDKLCDLGLEEFGHKAKNKDQATSRSFALNGGQSPTKVSKAEVRRQVWKNAKNQCENCESKQALQIDHIFPKAKGGSDTLENFRLLCRSCNQRSAINHFGVERIEKYLNQ
jgi:hypothetical protein